MIKSAKTLNYPSFVSAVPVKGNGVGYVNARVPMAVAERMQERFASLTTRQRGASFDYSISGELVEVVARVKRSAAQSLYDIFSEARLSPR